MSSGHIAVITARRADENRGRCVGRPPPAPGAAPDRAGLMSLPVDLRGQNLVVPPYFWVSVSLRRGPAGAGAQCSVWGRSARVPLCSDVCRRRVTVERLLRKYLPNVISQPGCDESQRTRLARCNGSRAECRQKSPRSRKNWANMNDERRREFLAWHRSTVTRALAAPLPAPHFRAAATIFSINKPKNVFFIISLQKLYNELTDDYLLETSNNALAWNPVLDSKYNYLF